MLFRICLIIGAMMSLSVNANATITPEQAVQAIKQFTNEPSLTVVNCTLNDTDSYGPLGSFYNISTTNHLCAGLYSVDYDDGFIITYDSRSGFLDDPRAVIDRSQAQSIAETFATAHFPSFTQGQWDLFMVQHDPNGRNYEFMWFHVLPENGAYEPYPLCITVDGFQSKVAGYQRPPVRDIVPIQPVITREQAIQIAMPYAIYDPGIIPLNQVYLIQEEDLVGIHHLTWYVNQQPDPANNPFDHVGARVNAVTGVIESFETPFGSASNIDPRLNKHRRNYTAHKASRYSVMNSHGKATASEDTLVMQKDQLWVRVETFRYYKSRVNIVRKLITITAGKTTISGSSVGAQWRNYGWWVPLRQVSEKLGWTVTWNPKERKVVVDNGTPQTPH